MEITQRDSFVVRIELPGIESPDINVTVERNTLRIVAKRGDSHAQYESTIEVPGGFAIAKARATYSNEQLRIVVPKAGGVG